MWRALFLAFILVAATEAKAVTVEGWQVSLFPDNNQPSGCFMTADFQSGTKFSLVVTSDYTWALALSNPSWNLAKDGSTYVAAYVDRQFVASGTAKHLDTNLALLPLSGARPYRALQRGYRLDLQTPLGNLSFSLEGTAKAMAAVLDCVQALNRTSTSVASTHQEQRDFYPVQAAEATVLLANLLNAAGIRDYELLPPTKNSPVVTFKLSDGTLGLMAAARGRTKSADDYASFVISNYSGLCKGSFLSGKEVVPSTDGTVIRKLTSMCNEDGKALVTETTVIRRPDGFLIEISQTFPDGGTGLQELPKEGQRGAIVDAAMRTSGDW